MQALLGLQIFEGFLCRFQKVCFPKESFGFSIGKILSGKKVLVSVLEKLLGKYACGFDFKNICLVKKIRITKNNQTKIENFNFCKGDFCISVKHIHDIGDTVRE